MVVPFGTNPSTNRSAKNRMKNKIKQRTPMAIYIDVLLLSSDDAELETGISSKKRVSQVSES